MRIPLWTGVAMAGIVMLLGANVGNAQSPGSSSSASAPPSTYRPGLGDLMTATVQPRHIKLALAGREKNWAYAAYELHELGEAFGRIARAWPEWQALPIPDMLHAALNDPMARLAQAIRNGDAAQFAAAYGQLTDGCNACHQGANRGFIAIQPPQASPYPDQDFRPRER